jgi:hypothetical protein
MSAGPQMAPSTTGLGRVVAKRRCEQSARDRLSAHLRLISTPRPPVGDSIAPRRCASSDHLGARYVRDTHVRAWASGAEYLLPDRAHGQTR